VVEQRRSDGARREPSGGSESDFERCVAAHDRNMARAGLNVWVGAEPTFTDRFSEAPEWLCEALGSDKENRARQLMMQLRERFPGGVVLRSLGRQYSGEGRPRWCYGLYARRDGEPVWLGPPDRLLDEDRVLAPSVALLRRLERRLLHGLRAHGWTDDPRLEEVAAVYALMLKDPSITRVDQLCRALGYSRRTLQRLFREYVGVTPKWVLQRVRLHEAAERIADEPSADAAMLALDLGYFDQAHFIKDFKAVVGRSPAEYAAMCAGPALAA